MPPDTHVHPLSADLEVVPKTPVQARRILDLLRQHLTGSSYWTDSYDQAVTAMIDDQARLAACFAMGTAPLDVDHAEHPAGLLPFMTQLIGTGMHGYYQWVVGLASGMTDPFPPMSLAIARAVTAFTQDQNREIHYASYGAIISAWDAHYSMIDGQRRTKACLLMHAQATHERPLGLLFAALPTAGTCYSHGRQFKGCLSYTAEQETEAIHMVGLVPGGAVCEAHPSDVLSVGFRRRNPVSKYFTCGLTRFLGWEGNPQEGVITQREQKIRNSGAGA
jgi:hypothetical protein